MKHNRFSLQIRLSLAAAIRPALQFVLVLLLMIPVTALIGLVFTGDRQIDWRVSVIVGSVLGFGWFAATFFSTLADLRTEDRIQTAKTPTFRARSFESGVCALATVFPVWLIIGLHQEHDPVGLQVMPLAIVALAFYVWPRTIRCGESSISQRNLFGWKKRIPYTSVEAISVGPNGTTTILGIGATIEHTSHHIDSIAFRELVSQRSGKPVY